VATSYLYQRKGSPFWYYGWTDETGKKHGESLKTTDKLKARVLQAEKDRKLLHGDSPKDHAITFAEWRKQYEETARVRKKSTSFKRDLTALNAFQAIINPGELRRIKHEHIQRFMNIRAEQTSKSTANIDFGTLHAFFNQAIQHDYIHKNPCKYVEKFSIPVRSRIPFTPAELDEIRSDLKKHGNQELWDMFMVFLYTGVRLNELCHLIKKYIYLNKGTYKIEAWDSNEIKGWPWNWKRTKFVPKNSQIRENPISDEILPIIRRRVEEVNGPLIFPGRNGVRSKTAVEELFERTFKRVKIEGKTIHNFRHTYITRMLESGEPIQEVSRSVGHSSVNVTMIYYTDDIRKKRESLAKYDPFGDKSGDKKGDV